MKVVTLGNKEIGPFRPPYVIAEIGGNFRTAEEAIRLIDLAAGAGVDAVKIQTFRADTLTTRKAVFEMENTGMVPQHELFAKFEVGEQVHHAIFEHARGRGITMFSTPSHSTDLDLLERLDAPCHKIGSDDAANIPFLKCVARTGKPVLLSTGMCTMTEVERALDAILEEGNEQVVLFHCTTNYPTHPESVNLKAMVSMHARFGVPIGYSDHTLGIDVCYTAAVLGASVLEFHFTHDKNADGPDHMLSKTPEETAELVRRLRQLPVILGDGVKRPMPSEMNTRRNNRKSIVLIADVKAGEKIGPRNIAIKRPGTGIPSTHWYEVLGKAASRDLAADEVLGWDDLT